MKIKKMKWWNYKGLPDGEIQANGHDVIIRGRNGSGKSTIAEILPFVLKGRFTGSLRKYDAGREILSGQLHGAEIEFDTGLTLRREITESSTVLNNAKLYVNGQKVSAGQFALKVNEITHGGDEYVINPKAFPALSPKKQREYLISLYLNGRADITASLQVAESTAALQRLKKKIDKNEALLDELRKTVEDIPADLDSEMARISSELVKAHEYLIKTSGKAQENARKATDALVGEYQSVKARLDSDKAYFTELANRYKSVETRCPTCGAPMPAEKVRAARAEIASKGRMLKAQITAMEARLKEMAEQVKAARAELEASEGSESARMEAKAKVTELQDIHSELKNMQTATERIAELEAEQKVNAKKRQEMEEARLAAQRYQQEQIEAAEERIATEFEDIRFKLWDVRATGEVYDTCEVLLGEVPYRALSTGEQWHAGLAIVKGLQRRYGVEMPLMIDNAESLTSNTHLEMPNQAFVFQVSGGELEVVVCDG